MVIGLAACLLLVALLRRRIGWRRPALQTYITRSVWHVGIHIYYVYWGAQHIPSVWYRNLRAHPVFTGWLAAVWLQERVSRRSIVLGMLHRHRWSGGDIRSGAGARSMALPGVAAVVVSVALHAVKRCLGETRVNARLHPLETTTGALIIVVPLYLLTGGWAAASGHHMSQRARSARLSAGLLGSVAGFVLYYPCCTQPGQPRRLITLVTPVLALLIGHALNAEQVGLQVWIGAAMILAGLASYQWGDAWRDRRLAIAPAGHLISPQVRLPIPRRRASVTAVAVTAFRHRQTFGSPERAMKNTIKNNAMG